MANHLADVKQHNVRTEMGSTRGLGATDIRGALSELDAGAAGGRTDRHAYHLHMDPAPTERWTDDTRRDAWSKLEREMGLKDAPYVEVRHTTWRDLEPGDDVERVCSIHGVDAVRERNGGGHQVLMAHEHRVYDLTRDNGSVVDLSHDFVRREKVARTVEHDHGFDFVPGKHNRTVASRLDVERPEVAAALRAAGLTTQPRPSATLSPKERAQSERTGVDPRVIGATALAAWRASDNGESFQAALREQGLSLAMGDRAPVIVDGTGNAHPLARILGKESKADGGTRIAAGDVRDRLDGMRLDRHEPGAVHAVMAPKDLSVPILVAPASVETVAAPQEAAQPVIVAPAPTAPAPRVAPASLGGATASSTPVGSIEGDMVAALDEKQRRQEAAVLQPQTGGSASPETNKDLENAISEFKASLRRIGEIAQATGRRVAAADAIRQARLEGVGDRRSKANPDHVGGRQQGDAAGNRQARPLAGQLRSVPGGAVVGQLATSSVVVGTQGRGIENRRSGVGDRKGLGHTETDYRRAGRNEINAGQDRAEAGRIEIALQSHGSALERIRAKLAALAGPADVVRRQREQAAAAWRASHERVGRVLATAPYPDPAQRDPEEIAWSMREQIRTKLAAEEAKAAGTRQAADRAKADMGILGKIGFPTADRRHAAELLEAAEVAQRQAVISGESYGHDMQDSDSRAPDIARSRQRQQAAWEQRPEVRRAVEERLGNELVQAAIRNGDRSIENLAGQDLARARQEMLRRAEVEAAELARQRDRLATQRVRSQPGAPEPDAAPSHAPGLRLR